MNHFLSWLFLLLLFLSSPQKKPKENIHFLFLPTLQ